MFSTRNFNRSKPVLFILILFPSLLWAYQFVTGNLGVNPIEKLMDELGLMALRLIIITLMITSLSNIKNLKSIDGTSAGALLAFVLMLDIDNEVIKNYIIDRPWEKVFNITPVLMR